MIVCWIDEKAVETRVKALKALLSLFAEFLIEKSHVSASLGSSVSVLHFAVVLVLRNVALFVAAHFIAELRHAFLEVAKLPSSAAARCSSSPSVVCPLCDRAGGRGRAAAASARVALHAALLAVLRRLAPVGAVGGLGLALRP